MSSRTGTFPALGPTLSRFGSGATGTLASCPRPRLPDCLGASASPATLRRWAELVLLQVLQVQRVLVAVLVAPTWSRRRPGLFLPPLPRTLLPSWSRCAPPPRCRVSFSLRLFCHCKDLCGPFTFLTDSHAHSLFPVSCFRHSRLDCSSHQDCFFWSPPSPQL